MKKKQLLGGLLAAGFMICAAIVLRYLVSIEYIDGEFSSRAIQVIIGFYLVGMGNAIPKTLESQSKECFEPSKAQSFKRFAGWTFVIAGLGYSFIWIVVPIEIASIWSMIIVFGALLLVMIPYIVSIIKRKRIHPPTEL